MNQLTRVFEGKKITINGTKKEPLFLLKDVCDVLNLTNTSEVAKRVRGKYKHQISLGLAGRSPLFVSEPGLYQVIMRADQSPVAERFQDWVYEEVLPSIRNTGSYEVPKGIPFAELFTATAQLLESQGKTEAAITELTEKVDLRMTLDYGQQLAIERAKKKRAEQLWQEFDAQPSDLYDTKGKLYGRFGSDIKRAFAVASYRDIRQNQFDEALSYVTHWRPALV